MAKFGLFPVSDEQLAEAGEIGKSDPPGVLRDRTRDFYRAHGARHELRVQLCTDLDAVPVEDASVEWDESVSPYRTVATLEIPPQESFGGARRVYAEDVLSRRPWYGRTAFRPLGSINRVRRRVYDELGAWRTR